MSTADASADAPADAGVSTTVIGVAVGASALVVAVGVAAALFIARRNREEGHLLFAETKPSKKAPHGAAFRQKLLLPGGSRPAVEKPELLADGSPIATRIVLHQPHDAAHTHGPGLIAPGQPASPLTRAASSKAFDRTRLESQATEKVRNALTIEARYSTADVDGDRLAPLPPPTVGHAPALGRANSAMPPSTPVSASRPQLQTQASALAPVAKCQRGCLMGRDVAGTRNKPHCTLCSEKIASKATFYRCQCTTACAHCAALLGGPAVPVPLSDAPSRTVSRF